MRAINREDVGDRLAEKNIQPALEYSGEVTLADGKKVEVATAFNMYKEHLADYDLDTVLEITESPRDLVERLIDDIATIRPVAFHIGEE
ncbi:MAG: hypothetical protein M5U19_20670 [Microthrixaceae bacterium]|nr:hypothetical protein [Microthrixaceae bacterium]